MKNITEYLNEGLFDMFTKMSFDKLREAMFKELQVLKNKKINARLKTGEIKNISTRFIDIKDDGHYILCVNSLISVNNVYYMAYTPIWDFKGITSSYPNGKVDKDTAKKIIEFCKDTIKIKNKLEENLDKQISDERLKKICDEINARSEKERKERERQDRKAEREEESEKIWRGQALFNSHF